MMDQQNEKTRPRATLLHWLRRSEDDFKITSLGEYLLPFFLAALEACWLNGLLLGVASVALFGSSSELLPFWAPLFLLCISILLFRRSSQVKDTPQAQGVSEGASPGFQTFSGLGPLFTLVGFFTVVLLWLDLYAANYFLFDPRWLVAAARDVFALNTRFYQLLVIASLSVYLCWRGMKLAQLRVESDHVLRQFWTGLCVFLLVILLRGGQAGTANTFNDTLLLLLLPIFLYLALAAHALARLTFVRRDHSFGLESSIVVQERAVLSVVSVVGLLLLITTFVSAAFFRPTFFDALQPLWQGVGIVYDWLLRGFGVVALVIITPFYWLLQWWFSRFPPHWPAITPINSQLSSTRTPPPFASTSPGVVVTANVLLFLVIFLLLFFVLRRILRGRKIVRISLKRRTSDLHESVWSWTLFLAQLRVFWEAFLRFLLRRKTSDNGEKRVEGVEVTGAPAVRTVREIYRVFLKRAERAGHRRKRDETAYEFQQRLIPQVPQIEPQINQLTESYTRVRYGESQPDEVELASVRQVWQELEHKWDEG